MTCADAALRELLSAGAMDSRAVQALMADRGFTAKQMRSARERLNVEVARSGNRAAMRSTWALPPGVEDTFGIRARYKKLLRQAKVDDGNSTVVTGEMNRIDQRVRQFTARGMDAAAGLDLATRLVVERDRVGSREGSCAECQCLIGLSCLPGAAGYTSGPRPLPEIWMCWTARRP